MTAKIKFWQWPNILAVDAGLLSAAWLWVFAREQSAGLGMMPYVILVLSVWLTYSADRLFDVSSRAQSQLLSARHQFAKRHARMLWLIWAGLLLLSITLAITSLSHTQLGKGFVLLFVCLTYTGLNQVLSKRFFPKELMVAVIFAWGTQVFLPAHTEWLCLAGFTLLCLANCLSIGWKEKTIDAGLKVRSLTNILSIRWINLLLLAGISLSLFSSCMVALLPSILGLALIHFKRGHFSREAFRVLCDSALLLGPLLYFFCSGVLVR